MNAKRQVEDIEYCFFHNLFSVDEETGEKSIYAKMCVMKFKDGTYAEPRERTDDEQRPTTELAAFREALGDETAEIPDRFKEELQVYEAKQIITLNLKVTHQERQQFKRPFSKKIADSLRQLADFVEDEKNDNEMSVLLPCGTSCSLRSEAPDASKSQPETI